MLRLVAVLILHCFCIWPQREVKCGVEEGRNRGKKEVQCCRMLWGDCLAEDL